MRRVLILLGAACGLTLLSAVPVRAQLNGSHTLGDFGVKAGSQPAPGFYAALSMCEPTPTPSRTLRETPSACPELSRERHHQRCCPPAVVREQSQIFGATYGVMTVLPWANASLEAPAFALANTVGTNFTDMLVRPLDLGWHTKQADVSAGFQFYVPTGRYTLGGSDNIGKGMWSYEPFIGTTLYFDEARTTSFATTAFWELHGKKEDSNVKVGEILSLEGGVGKSFLGGGLVIGGAYYAQWKSPGISWPISCCPAEIGWRWPFPTSTGCSPSGRT